MSISRKGAFVLNKAVMKAFAIKARKTLIDEILIEFKCFAGFKNREARFATKDPVKQECLFQLQKKIEETDVVSVAEEAACIWFHPFGFRLVYGNKRISSDRTVFL